MIRVTRLSGKYYGFKFADLEDEAENIMELINQGEPVIIVEDIEDIESLDIYDEIIMVEPVDEDDY